MSYKLGLNQLKILLSKRRVIVYQNEWYGNEEYYDCMFSYPCCYNTQKFNTQLLKVSKVSLTNPHS